MCDFSKNSNAKDGLCSKCKKCYKEYYKTNKEEITKKSLTYRTNNREEIALRQKEYASRNKKVRNKRQKYNLENNINFRLARVLRSRVYNALNGNAKPESTLKLLGCSIENFKSHLEFQFTKGMSWKTYGLYGWHIDHVKPCDAFDLSDPQQQKECFHYSNMQPLWAGDNIRKGHFWND